MHNIYKNNPALLDEEMGTFERENPFNSGAHKLLDSIITKNNALQDNK